MRRFPMTRSYALLICGLSLLAILGCGSGNSVPGAYGSLTFAATTDKSIYVSGERVHITLAVKNNGTQPVTMKVDGYGPFDTSIISVKVQHNGAVVVDSSTWLRGGVSPPDVTVQPGETKSALMDWDQK